MIAPYLWMSNRKEAKEAARIMVAYNKAEEHIKLETDLSRMVLFTEELKRIDLTGAPMETRRALNGIIVVAEDFQKVLREQGNTNQVTGRLAFAKRELIQAVSHWRGQPF